MEPGPFLQCLLAVQAIYDGESIENLISKINYRKRLYAAVIYVSHQQSLTQHPVFGSLNEALGGKTVRSDEEVNRRFISGWRNPDTR